MSVIRKLHRQLKSVPFWKDLADAIDQELILFQRDRILPMGNFFESRTLDQSNFAYPTDWPSFSNYNWYAKNILGFSPYSELWYSPIKPAISCAFPSLSSSYPLNGWQGASGLGGNNHIPGVTWPGTYSTNASGYLDASSGVALTLQNSYTISAMQGTLILNLIPFYANSQSLVGSSGSGLQVALTGYLSQVQVKLAGNLTTVPLASALNAGQAYQMALRFRAGYIYVFVNGVLSGSSALVGTSPLGPGTVTADPSSNQTQTITQIGGASDYPAFTGQIGSFAFFQEALSDAEILSWYQGQDLSDPAYRLNLSDPLHFMRGETKYFGYRVQTRGSKLFYEWVFNKAKMTGRAYQLFLDPVSNILIKAITDPLPLVANSLANPIVEPATIAASDFGSVNKLDSGLTLDASPPWHLDETYLGKTVVPTKHFALEMVLGMGRDDNGNSAFPRYTDYDQSTPQQLFLQKHLDYLLYEALWGKSITEFPHVGVQLNLSANRSDTSGRYDLTTWTKIVVSSTFPSSGWSTSTVAQIKAQYGGYSYTRSLSTSEVDLVQPASGAGTAYMVINAMIPALAVGPVIETGVNLQTSYSTTITPTPIAPGTLTISFVDSGTGDTFILRDDAQGHLFYSHIVPDLNHWSGTIDYSTGALTWETFMSAGPTFISGWSGPTVTSFNVNGTPISINFKTQSNVPLTAIELLDGSNNTLVVITPQLLTFLNPANHLSLMLTLNLQQ